LSEENEWWHFDNLSPITPQWYPAGQGDNPYDLMEYHIDLGGGKLPKGRLTVDRHGDADVLMDLNTLEVFKFGETEMTSEYKMWFDRKLPFPDNSIESMISHHCLEHIGDGFLRLMDECYRVLKVGGVFRIIVPLFPSLAAVSDPDHVRYFCENTFESFCGDRDESVPFWSDVFAEPYTKCRFELVDKITTPVREDRDLWHPENAREIRVALRK
jgi:SAM-dependent methyltransferase